MRRSLAALAFLSVVSTASAAQVDEYFACVQERAKIKIERDGLNFFAGSLLETRTQVEKVLASQQAENARLREEIERLKREIAEKEKNQ